MNRRHDYERQIDSGRYGYREEPYRGGHRGSWDWPDQVWSGEGNLDEGGAGRGSPRPGGYGRRRRGASPYEPRYGERQYRRGVYGQDQFGWIEYDEPRYVGSLYRGERHGEEPYREHEWQQSRQAPGMLRRVFARGPKGYTRSDERIKEDFAEQLWRAGHVDSSDVTIAVENGVLELTGTVPERWMRHELEDIADNCMGVREIENKVRVQTQAAEG